MCLCTYIRCEGCGYSVPVHVADFCCGEEEVQTRCATCPPPDGEAGWVAFDRVPAWVGRSRSFDDDDSPHAATFWLRYVGDADLLGEYGVSEEGGIVPNTACHWERGVPIPEGLR